MNGNKVVHKWKLLSRRRSAQLCRCLNVKDNGLALKLNELIDANEILKTLKLAKNCDESITLKISLEHSSIAHLNNNNKNSSKNRRMTH